MSDNVSRHFNHYSATNEQNLIQDLVDESIYLRGLEVVYIPRTQDNIDFLYKEDPSQYYNSFKLIAMFPLFVDGFDGQEVMSMFGNEFQKSGTFVASKRKWADKFPEFKLPREGDLIYMPVTKAFLEIKYVELESPFFEKGKQYVFELKTEAFEFSYEDINTGNEVVDALTLSDLDILNQDVNTESYGDNAEIEEEHADDIEYNPNNPFSVR